MNKISFFQLRVNKFEKQKIIFGEKIRNITKRYRVKFLVNDDPLLAKNGKFRLKQLFDSGLDNIRISLYDGPHQINLFEDLKKLLQEIPDCDIEQDGGIIITIHSTNSEIVLMNVLKILNQNNISIEDLSAVPTNLEEIFLKVVSDSNASNY